MRPCALILLCLPLCAQSAARRRAATSPVRRGDAGTLGAMGSVLIDNDGDDYVGCAVVAGALEISAGARGPVEIPGPRAAR